MRSTSNTNWTPIYSYFAYQSNKHDSLISKLIALRASELEGDRLRVQAGGWKLQQIRGKRFENPIDKSQKSPKCEGIKYKDT